jgi:surface antigen
VLKTPTLKKSLRRRLVRFSLVGLNILLLGGVLYLVIAPDHGSASAPQVASTSAVGSFSQQTEALDQLASASIAKTVAEMTGVAEKTAITNQADTERANLNQASLDDDSLAFKPQVIESAYKSNKDIQLYTVLKGDTIPKIATKFGITSDSIRWSNNLSGNDVAAGKKLRIPPVNGMVYIVKKGDTAKSLALRYNVSEAKLIQYNDAELHGIKAGEMIILPDASKAAQIARNTIVQREPSYGYNGYDYGYCTWWVANMRIKAGNPLPVGLGDASSWPYWSKAFGLPHGTEPRVGAAVVTQFGGQGHVAYVIGVKGSDTITISEMNFHSAGGGWGRTDTRTITGDFYYIY